MGMRSRVVLAAAAVLGIACGRESDAATGEVSRAWAPAQARTIAGVSADDSREAIQRRLHGTRPAEITAERWLHAQRLYNSYNGAALWMETEGPNKPRTNALLRAIVNASDDALRLDAYPLADLVQSIGAVRDLKRRPPNSSPTRMSCSRPRTSRSPKICWAARPTRSSSRRPGTSTPADAASTWTAPSAEPAYGEARRGHRAHAPAVRRLRRAPKIAVRLSRHRDQRRLAYGAERQAVETR